MYFRFFQFKNSEKTPSWLDRGWEPPWYLVCDHGALFRNRDNGARKPLNRDFGANARNDSSMEKNHWLVILFSRWFDFQVGNAWILPSCIIFNGEVKLHGPLARSFLGSEGHFPPLKEEKHVVIPQKVGGLDPMLVTVTVFLYFATL
jgi:hypothetical protein